jgi:regulator of protease activity HflC (stomatin/prohibitin superfamily)
MPPQEVITKDNVPARVNAVAYFHIVDPKAAIVNIENFLAATTQIAQTTLRSVLGQHMLEELLSEREKINAILQGIIDEQTAPWGIEVSIVEVKDVEIPGGMQRAMARQAEADRAAAPVPADAARARRLAVDHDRLRRSDRHDQAVLRELQQAARDHSRERS